MFRKVIAITALAAAVTLTVQPVAHAGKANDELVWSTNRGSYDCRPILQ